MLRRFAQFFQRVVRRMADEQGAPEHGNQGGSVDRQQSNESWSEDRYDDHARSVLQSVPTRPSEVTIGMIKQTNGCSGLQR